MPKNFSEQERNVIRDALITNCKACWSKYGYKRTNVAELCKMSGISTGAFYQFFQSKEQLFIVAAQDAGKELITIFEDEINRSPNKLGISNGLKAMIKKLETMEWYMSLIDEFVEILHKLPEESLKEDLRSDISSYIGIFNKYNIVPKIEVSEIITIFSIISSALMMKGKLAGDVTKAIDFIIDSVIDKLFE